MIVDDEGEFKVIGLRLAAVADTHLDDGVLGQLDQVLHIAIVNRLVLDTNDFLLIALERNAVVREEACFLLGVFVKQEPVDRQRLQAQRHVSLNRHVRRLQIRIGAKHHGNAVVSPLGTGRAHQHELVAGTKLDEDDRHDGAADERTRQQIELDLFAQLGELFLADLAAVPLLDLGDFLGDLFVAHLARQDALVELHSHQLAGTLQINDEPLALYRLAQADSPPVASRGVRYLVILDCRGRRA